MVSNAWYGFGRKKCTVPTEWFESKSNAECTEYPPNTGNDKRTNENGFDDGDGD